MPKMPRVILHFLSERDSFYGCVSYGSAGVRKGRAPVLCLVPYKQGSTLTFEGTCQVGQVNMDFYLTNTIFICFAKGVQGCNFLHALYM